MIVTVTSPPAATVPIVQVSTPPTGAGQLPPGEEFAKVNVKPEPSPVPVRDPLKITWLAASGPLLVKAKVKVTWFPTVAGFGLTVGVEV